MKRIIAFMLSLMLASSFVGTAFIAEAADNLYNVEKSLNMLKAIGQFTDYDMATVEQNKEVSRGEFTQGLADLLQLRASGNDLFYHDVPKVHFAYDGITAITECGYARGYEGGLFKPDKIMTRNEAAILLVSALGYNVEAMATGGSEGDYIKIAMRLELFENTSSGSNMTFGDMLIMFTNALLTPLYEISSFDTAPIYEESDKTWLSLYYDCYYAENERVTGANNTGIYGESRSDNMVVIGKDEYLPISDNMENYLGSYVNFIYKTDKNDDLRQIVWIEKEDKYDEIVLGEDVIEGFDSGSYTYRYCKDNGRIDSISLDRNISVIYNGCFEKDAERFLKKPCTEIRFLENKEGKFDTAIISDYTNYIINTVDMKEEVFTVRYANRRISIAEGDYEKLIVLDENLNVISAEELVSDATVSVFESDNKKYMKLIVSQKTMEGVIEGVDVNTGMRSTATVNGTEYKLSRGIDTNGLQLGKNAFIYLDFNNAISYIKKDFANGYMAYIIKVTKTDDEEGINIKAFNQDGEIKIYDTVDTLRVDKIRHDVSDGDALPALLDAIDEKLVMLEFDSEGKIKNIDTAEGEGDFKICAPYEENCRYRGVSPKIGRLTCIDSSTKIFSVPENPKEAEAFEFSVKAKGQLGDWRQFNAESYNCTNESDYADAVLISGFGWNDSGDTSDLFVYRESFEAVNNNGEAVTVLAGMVGSEEVEYYCAEGFTPPEFSVGSALFLNFNGNGEIYEKSGERIITEFDKNSSGGESSDNLAASKRIVTGYVNRVNGNIISIGYTSPDNINEKFDITGTPIIVVDESKQKDRVSAGNVTDIISYEDAVGSDGAVKCSKIAVHTHQMSQRVVVVYKQYDK